MARLSVLSPDRQGGGRAAYVLSSQLILDRTVRYVPTRTSIRQTFRFGRVEVYDVTLHVDVSGIEEVVGALTYEAAWLSSRTFEKVA